MDKHGERFSKNNCREKAKKELIVLEMKLLGGSC